MTCNVATMRNAGLEAKWGKTRRGAPALFVRDPNAETPHQRETWWMVNKGMWESMKEAGVREGFGQYTLLGDMFSIPA